MYLTKILISLLAATLCLGPSAYAAGQPIGQEPPIKEVRLESSEFSRGEPIPAWVEEVPIPKTELKNPVVIKLADTQLNATDTPQTFVHRVLQVNQSAALGQVGQIPINFVPQYEKLRLHSVRILRGNDIIDQTDTVNIHFLQRETGYENGLYSGIVTVVLLLADVRVGDVVEYKYSTEGANPVFGKKFQDYAGWDQSEPIVFRSVILNHAANRKINWKMIGDFQSTNINPTVKTAHGMTQLRFEGRDIRGVDNEPYIPTSYYPARILQFSEYQSWNEVAQWASGLFSDSQPLPDELNNQIAQWRTLPSEEDRVAKALQWVQTEIRYFSVSIGESSHRPHAPLQVVRQRYGDCKDKSNLLLSVLRELGISAKPVLLSVSSRTGVGKQLPSPSAFDHVIVQVSVRDKKYYLDGTQPGQNSKLPRIGAALAGIPALVAAPGTTGLSPIPSTENQLAAQEEWNEKILLPKLGEDGTLELDRFWQAAQAEQARYYFNQLSPDQLRKFTSASYEKLYPGIELLSEPTIVDDVEQNHIRLRAKFKIPALAVNLNSGWGIRYFPGILRGMFNMPDNLKRNFPVAVPTYPYKGRYTLSLDWPEEVSAALDPHTEKIGNDYFSLQLTQSFRGNHASITVDFATKATEIPAKDLQGFSDDLKKLNRTIGEMIIVGNQSIKKSGLLGMGRQTIQDSLKQRIKLQIEGNSKAINSGRLKGDDLAEAYCSRATSLADYEQPIEGLKDAKEAVRIAPAFARAWACRGELNFDNGKFNESIADFTTALSLGYDEFSIYYKRGQAKYFLNDYAVAATDLEKAVDMRQDSADQLYASLWLVIALKNQGKPIPDKIQLAVQKNPHGEWPAPALSLLLGISTPEQMQMELNRKKGDDFELSQVEAMFYLGQYYLLQGKTDLAISEFKKLREKHISIYTEHVSAGFELRRLEKKPKTPHEK